MKAREDSGVSDSSAALIVFRWLTNWPMPSPKRGCWINVAGDKEFQTIRIKVEDGVIVFPMTDKGKKVVAEGTFKKMELTKEQAIERAKHEAEEKGTKCDESKITGPQTVYQIMGVGAVVE